MTEAKPEPLSPDVFPADGYVFTHPVVRHSAMIAGYGYELETRDRVFLKARDAGDDGFGTVRLEREANVLESLSHDQIPHLIEAHLEGKTPFIVTEAMPDDPFLRGRRFFAPDFAARLALSIVDPLEHVHDKSITHRDIKPGNLTMLGSAEVGLLDFDLALTEEERVARTKQPHYFVGTPRYATPEQAYGGDIASTTDIYAAGITLFELLTGRVPYEGATLSEVCRKWHDGSTVDYRNGDGDDIPEALAFIIEKAIRYKPDHRYQYAGEMAEDLERYLASAIPL